MKKIIDYVELEKPINSIEKILNDFDQEEKSLILKIINQRFNRIIQEQKSDEISRKLLNKIPGSKFLFGGDEK